MKAERQILGILAHVDAGKTTLAESMLYLCGKLRKPGRVDHKDAFLDTYEMERARGITIFSKQAELMLQEKKITLLDTPGHVDFSAEMERTLQVLDYAVLLISGADGVQGHVETLWKLLKRYEVPVFLFVNKMDQEGTDKEKLLAELRERLSENCMDFSNATDLQEEAFCENLALCDEKVMEAYLSTGSITTSQIKGMVKERKLFPCFFGSALKMQGVQEFLDGLHQYTEGKTYPKEFGARVFKISRDEHGNRLTHMKITGGNLKVKTLLTGSYKHGYPEEAQSGEWQEKVDQLRVYSGSTFETQQEIPAGAICAVTGLTQTYAGQGLGREESVNQPVLEPVLNYRMLLPEDCQVHVLLQQLRQLEEEEPLLRILWEEELGEIHVQMMGDVQIEVIKALIEERFHTSVEFGSGNIVYKETLLEQVEGVGHFEPLRHYAEVHLLMEPAKPGSGLQFFTDCSEDKLDKNWQRLILTHLEEKKHRGVLTGSEITDIKITLVAGKAHQKHTEGGDFRQATYRAVRQGLKMGNCRLLEPVYEFRIEVPLEMVGRVMSDIQKMHGNFSGPETLGEKALLTGTAPVVTMQGYQKELMAFSRGCGRMSCNLKGYEPCHNEEEVIEAIGYDSERDLENPTGSVFCSHGAGFVVDYSQVYEYMHLEGILAGKTEEHEQPEPKYFSGSGRSSTPGVYDEDELKEIFRRTYGEGNQERRSWTKKVIHSPAKHESGPKIARTPQTSQKEYLLVDGYNIIFGWEDLKELAKVDLSAARGKLMDILCNYQGYKKNVLILVFDAYKVAGNPGSTQKYHNIHVVYTKEAETADQYIEKVTHEIGKKHRVTVATSDALEQVIILGQGANRMSAQGLLEEIKSVSTTILQEIESKTGGGRRNYLFDHISEEERNKMQEHLTD